MSMTAADEPTPYAQAAGHLVLAGWWPLPLPARSKKSPPEGYTGGSGRAPSPDDLTTWIRTQAAGNVAVRLPPDVVGIDVDAYGDKPGGATLAQLEADHGPLPPTVIVTSRHDGVSGIRLYRLPDGVDQATFRTGWPGIEILRYGHRYVIAPPSLHPDTGEAYRCFDPATGEVLATLPPKTDLPVLPEAWAAECAKPQRIERTTTAVRPVGGSSDPYAPCKAMSAALADILGQFGSGQARHDVATAGALRLARLDDMGHHGGTYALDVLGRTLVNAITDRLPRGQAVREWEGIVDSARARVAETPTPASDKGCCGADSAAARQQAATDRWLADLAAQEAAPAAAPARAEQESDDTEDRPRTSWWPRDLTGALTGAEVEPEPEHLRRADDKALFYAGKVNGIIGESESGKTWVALEAVRQALDAGQHVTYLDFEDTPAGIVARLRALDVPDDQFARLAYIGPEEALGLEQRGDLAEALLEHRPALIVLDGFNAAMTVMGLDLMSNSDATRFAQTLLRPLSSTGAAVVYVDHVPKSADNRGKGGIGAQAKRAMTTGCAISVEVSRPFGRGSTGKLRLTVDKDRPGHVRAVAAGAKYVGTAELQSDGLTGAVTVRIHEPDSRPPDERPPFRPTHLMEQVSIAVRSSPEPLSGRAIEEIVKGKAEAIRQAIQVLVQEGYLTRFEGPKRSLMHRHVRPYYEHLDRPEGDDDDDD